jgi:hypothetical protein
VFKLYQNIIQSDEWDEFATQSGRDNNQKALIETATNIFSKPEQERTESENKRLTQHNQQHEYQKLLYQ